MLKNKILLLLIFLFSLHLGSYAGMDWMKAAQESLSRQNIEAAIFYYSKAIEDKPTYTLAYLKRSTAYLLNGDALRSARDRRIAYELDPETLSNYLKVSKNFSTLN